MECFTIVILDPTSKDARLIMEVSVPDPSRTSSTTVEYHCAGFTYYSSSMYIRLNRSLVDCHQSTVNRDIVITEWEGLGCIEGQPADERSRLATSIVEKYS